MLDQLLEVGFLTGSRAFGTNRENSDYDVVYSIEDSQRIKEIIALNETTPSDYFAGYCIQDGDKTINLIPVHPHEFLPWYLATKAMRETLKASGIDDPIRKYSVFMGIVSLFKGTVEQRHNLSEYEKIKPEIIAGTL
jgi:predicted nucleotidyltransferase